jgi:hypothetical protein
MELNGKDVNLFIAGALSSIKETRALWKSRQNVDIYEFMLDVLAFRNFDLFESVQLILDSGRPSIGEILMRPLLEGTLLLCWCLQDPGPHPKKRVLRFRRTSIEEMIELVDSGFLKRSPQYVQDLRDSLAWFEKELSDCPPSGKCLKTLIHSNLERAIHSGHSYPNCFMPNLKTGTILPVWTAKQGHAVKIRVIQYEPKICERFPGFLC